MTNLQQKVEGLQTANILMREDLATSKNSVLDLQQEISRLQHARDMQLDQHQRMLQVASTIVTSVHYVNMYIEALFNHVLLHL